MTAEISEQRNGATVAIDNPAVRGALLLDERGPDRWWDKVDLDRLDISSVTDCVCGQVFGGFWAGLNALHVPEMVPAAHYGFARRPGVGHELEDSWREQVLARRARHALLASA